jgi:hypothetical protein
MRPVDELSDRDVRERLKRANGTIAEIDAADAREVVRAGKADETLARLGAAIDTVQEAGAGAPAAPSIRFSARSFATEPGGAGREAASAPGGEVA